jgi:hypothetical protein
LCVNYNYSKFKMGTTCGGVTGACCSHDVSVDIKNQVDNGNNPRTAN